MRISFSTNRSRKKKSFPRSSCINTIHVNTTPLISFITSQSIRNNKSPCALIRQPQHAQLGCELHRLNSFHSVQKERRLAHTGTKTCVAATDSGALDCEPAAAALVLPSPFPLPTGERVRPSELAASEACWAQSGAAPDPAVRHVPPLPPTYSVATRLPTTQHKPPPSLY